MTQPGQELQPYRIVIGEDAAGAQGQDQDQRPGQQPEQGVVPGPEEQVRVWTTEQLRALIRNLRPYVDGTFGTVSTKHVQVYMSAIRELNKLWHAYYVPPPPVIEPDTVEEEVRERELARITRQRVLDQLQELRARTRT